MNSLTSAVAAVIADPAGRSGVLHTVQRAVEPDLPEAADDAVAPQLIAEMAGATG